MQVYLVGGAVRDKLLNLATKEHDWVVVGATVEQMLSLGYKSVGRNFPVFLHPKTQDEYALARKERKVGVGYYGFECISDPSITLEQDLLRRDLTINAMAMDDRGHIIDPYNGKQDLANKILRHVSDAFVEDPVRVLRVARFYARFKHLGFKIAPETLDLMRKITGSGELNHLVAERVWHEWQLSLLTNDPAAFILALRQSGALKILLPEIDNLFGFANSAKFHQEVDLGIHTLQVIEAARALSNSPEFIFAMTLQDLSNAHIQNIIKRWKIPNSYARMAMQIMRWQGFIHNIDTLTAEQIYSVLDGTDAIRKPDEIFKFLLLSGQTEHYALTKNREYPQLSMWNQIIKACQMVKVTDIIKQNIKGNAIKHALKQVYLEYINDCCKK
jgi:tRNA nucleotidyltransferase (CCA-adding enzyme)